MGAGLGLLRLPPDQFWRLTPRELAAALAVLAPARPPGLGRAGLQDLMARFPDAPAERECRLPSSIRGSNDRDRRS